MTNWRFRQDLALEILKLIHIFKSETEAEEIENVTRTKEAEQQTLADNTAKINAECLEYLSGYALRLLMDRVHSVREVALDAIVARIRFCNEVQLWDLVAILIEAFANCNHWRRRQIFAQLCDKLVRRKGRH